MVHSAPGVPPDLAQPCRLPKPTRRRRAVRARSAYLPAYTRTSPTRWPGDNGERERRADDDALDERLADAHRADDASVARDEPDRRPAVPRRGERRRCGRRRSPCTGWYWARPHEQQGLEIGVPLRLARRAEHRRGDRGRRRARPPPPATSRRRSCGPSWRRRAAACRAGRRSRSACGRRRSSRSARVDHVRMNGIAERRRQQRRRRRGRSRRDPAWSSPCGFSKCVVGSPSACAFAFISATNRGIEPSPTWTASAVAASFALGTSAAIARSRTVSRSPGRRMNVDSPIPRRLRARR